MASIAMLDEESIKEIAQSAYAKGADDMYELVKSKFGGFKSDVQPLANLTGKGDGKFGSRSYLDKILQEIEEDPDVHENVSFKRGGKIFVYVPGLQAWLMGWNEKKAEKLKTDIRVRGGD